MTDDLRLPDLDRDLAGAADRLWVPPGDVDAVVGRARHRARRHRRAAALATVVLFVGAATGVSLSRRADDPGREVAAGGTVTRGTVDLDWARLTPSSGLGYSASVGGEGVLYALSTAPGQAQLDRRGPNKVLWRSEDGVEWTATTTFTDDLYLSDLASGGDSRIYAVGTAPATASVGSKPTSDLVAGWSDDGGRTWERAVLPYDMREIAASARVAAVSQIAVAAGPHGILAVAVPHVQLDVPQLVPDGVSISHGWALTATGVDVLGPRPATSPCPPGSGVPADAVPPDDPPVATEVGPYWCGGPEDDPVVVTPQEAQGVVASFTWAQLGVEGDLLRAARRQPIAFLAPPGGTEFERVALPAMDPVAGSVVMAASDDGFDVAVTTYPGLPGLGRPGITVLRSPDGRSWEQPAALPGDLDYVAAAGELNGRLTLVGVGAAGGTIVRSDGGGGWVSTPLAGALAPADLDGRATFVTAAGIGPSGAVVAVALVPKGPEEPRDVEYRLLASRDGETWGEQPLVELVGERIRTVHRAYVDGERFLVAVSVGPEGGGGQGTSRQVVLVGTPR